jgi:hypothetical protein
VGSRQRQSLRRLVIDFPSIQPASNSANMWNESALNNKKQTGHIHKMGNGCCKKNKKHKKKNNFNSFLKNHFPMLNDCLVSFKQTH